MRFRGVGFAGLFLESISRKLSFDPASDYNVLYLNIVFGSLPFTV